MKKSNKRMAILIIAITLVLTIFYPSTIKAATTRLSASSATVKSGETFSVTVTSSVKLSGWTISLSNNGGCTFSNASGGTVTGTSVFGTSLDGATTLARYTFKAPNVTKDTTYTISFSGTDMCDATDDVNTVGNTSCSAKITVKAKQTPTPSTKPTTTTTPTTITSPTSGSSGNSNTPKPIEEPKTPTFVTTNKTVYTTGNVNLRSSWSTSSTATTVEKDTELKLTGTSSEVIDGYTWYRVTYNGKTMYVASSLITETKPKKEEKDKKSSNKNLSSLKIEGVELTPVFNKETTRYSAKVDGDVTELKIEAKAEDSKAKVVVDGNKELKEGDNIVKIKVTAENDTTRTYFIAVTKGEGTVTDTNLKLSELKIAKVNFEESFDPDVYTYELTLNDFVEKLDITATPNQADATVEITGNENFEEGKNVVTIILTSADGTKVVTYQIEVNLPVEAAATRTESPNIILYAIIGAGIVVILIIIGTIIHHIKATREERESKEDEYNLSTKNDNYEEHIARDYNIKTTEKEQNKKATLDEFLNVDERKEDEGGKPRRPRGRHSI